MNNLIFSVEERVERDGGKVEIDRNIIHRRRLYDVLSEYKVIKDTEGVSYILSSPVPEKTKGNNRDHGSYHGPCIVHELSLNDLIVFFDCFRRCKGESDVPLVRIEDGIRQINHALLLCWQIG